MTGIEFTAAELRDLYQSTKPEFGRKLRATIHARDAQIGELEESLSGDAAAFVNLHKQLERIDTERNALRAEVERLKVAGYQREKDAGRAAAAEIEALRAKLAKTEERGRLLGQVYDAVAGEAIVWRREDGGENKLAIAIANVRGEEGKT